MSSNRSFLIATLLVVAIAVTSTVGADALPPSPNGKGINVLTLHMQRVSMLEAALHQAVNERDAIALGKLLSPFFEIRRAGGVIVERDAWMREGIRSDGELHQLAAYEVGNSVIANFTLVAVRQPKRFVVDVWTLDQDEWRLRVRFETTQARSQSKLPPPGIPNIK